MPRWTDRIRSGRGALPLFLGLGGVQAGLWIAGLPPGVGAGGFGWRALVLFGLQLVSVWLVWNRNDRGVIATILVLTVVFRIAAWTWPPDLSSDLYRYVWDGRVQMAGHGPYDAPPADESLAHLRDSEIWPHINRPEAVTVYPPGGELTFLALAAAGVHTVDGVKAAAVAVELVAVLLLLLVLRERRLPAGRIALYAWCPLVISEVAVSGHLDALVLPLMVGALWLAGRRAPVAAGGLVGAAALLKVYPLLLLAAVPPGGRVRAAAAAAGVVLAGYALYLPRAGARVLGFLPEYVRSGEDFNLGLRGFLQNALGTVSDSGRPVAMVICGVLLAIAVLVVASRKDRDAFRSARSIALAFVLLVPTAVHPWYAAWMVPLLVVHPSASGVWLAGLLPLSYAKYGTVTDEMPAAVHLLVWLPAFLFLLVDRARWRGDT